MGDTQDLGPHDQNLKRETTRLQAPTEALSRDAGLLVDINGGKQCACRCVLLVDDLLLLSASVDICGKAEMCVILEGLRIRSGHSETEAASCADGRWNMCSPIFHVTMKKGHPNGPTLLQSKYNCKTCFSISANINKRLRIKY
ncbi:hypothetical protein scyTo_0005910 [Scyliorhinus torazame]|uniref:Uncharacterized protein n=1 Tax=Scyliorhinus torazame TaxID=75743 RepID=A0A401PE15_SCYTO|nr:hypothetical protein [Scyliorhinus torazame]